jgi:hypothetical protein
MSLNIITIIILSSIRPTKIRCGYYETESFHQTGYRNYVCQYIVYQKKCVFFIVEYNATERDRMRFDNDMSIFQILKSKEQGKYLKSSILWDITPHSPVKANQSFGKNLASIFRVEQLAKQETSTK